MRAVLTITRRELAAYYGSPLAYVFIVIFLGLAGALMRLIEPKTRQPERFSRLEVEDVDAEDARSRSVRLEDADGEVLAEAIFGKQRNRLTGVQQSGTYLRMPGDEQSWLASGGLEIASEVTAWLDSSIMDVASEEIRRIELDPLDADAYVVARGRGRDVHRRGSGRGRGARGGARLRATGQRAEQSGAHRRQAARGGRLARSHAPGAVHYLRRLAGHGARSASGRGAGLGAISMSQPATSGTSRRTRCNRCASAPRPSPNGSKAGRIRSRNTFSIG
jgi:hypothetical protein